MDAADDKSELEEAAVEPSTVSGISTAFGAYKTPQEEDYRSVLTTGLVVLDTNTLLNLYRYTKHARSEFLKVLRALGDQLWVPHHVATEFWNNREDVVREAQSAAQTAADSLEEVLVNAQKQVRTWMHRVSLPAAQLEPFTDRIDAAFKAMQAEMVRLGSEHGLENATKTHGDPVVSELEAILEGKVGGPFSLENLRDVIAEGEKRSRESIPPGFKDRKKVNGNAAGDYVMWEQTLREASRRSSDVLLVTGDTKEDWWRVCHGEVRGPRPELYEELRVRSGTRLFLMRPETFLMHANALLQLSVSSETFSNVQWVDESAPLPGDILIERMIAARDAREAYRDYATENLENFAYARVPGLKWGDFSFEIHGRVHYFDVLTASKKSDKFVVQRKKNKAVAISDMGPVFTPAFLFTQRPTLAVLAYLEDDEVSAIWPEGDGWDGTKAARAAGLL